MIEARRSSNYIQTVVVNGKQWKKLWVSHREIAYGGSIGLILGDQLNTNIETQEEVAPPSPV
jgi:putative alpha-1,2-mannosidase